MKGWFSQRQPFDQNHLGKVPKTPGTYLIWVVGQNTPAYSGISKNLWRRLKEHFHCHGNKGITAARCQGVAMEFQFQEEDPEQNQLVEPFLIYQFKPHCNQRIPRSLDRYLGKEKDQGN